MIGNAKFSEWFKTSVGVRQGCILSPILFNVYLERIMLDTLEGFDGGIRCGRMKFSNLTFADDIDLLAEGEEELQEVTDRLNIISKKYGMEINREKSKVMVTGSCNGRKDININIDGKPVEQVTMFKYLRATITEDATSRKEVEIRICQATGALARLSSICKANTISIDKKLKLLRAIATSTLLYGCESWTLDNKCETKIRAFEMKCYRRKMNISWKDKKTNEYVREKVKEALGQRDIPGLVEIIKKTEAEIFWAPNEEGTLIGSNSNPRQS